MSKKLFPIYILFIIFFGCEAEKKKEPAVIEPQKIELTEKTYLTETKTELLKLSIPSIHCEGCEETITEAAMDSKGVTGISITKEKIALIKYDPQTAKPDEIKKNIEDAGYKVVDLSN